MTIPKLINKVEWKGQCGHVGTVGRSPAQAPLLPGLGPPSCCCWAAAVLSAQGWLLSVHQARKSSGCHCHPQDLSHLSQPEEETLEALDWHTGFLCAKGNTDNNTQGLRMHQFYGDPTPGPQLVLSSHLRLTLMQQH